MRCAHWVGLVAVLLLSGVAWGATLPANFVETPVATGLSDATSMEIAPDGRVFICRQSGELRVVKNGALLPTPFNTFTVDNNGERGLLGVCFDPDFATNQFIYVYYTVPLANGGPYNQVSRVTANGDVMAAGSEILVTRLDNLSGATNHNGGAIHFGPDGKLYVAVGENATAANSQTLSNRLGKILRMNADGTPPSDNPFFGTATGDNRQIWTLGLRNPFTFEFQPGTGRMFINDVGQNTFEEINDGIAGSNYGWPTTEGATSNPAFRSPLFTYSHVAGDTGGCAITGGTFYPSGSQFPTAFNGVWFYADFCNGWIRYFNPADSSSTLFATGTAGVVDFNVDAAGSLLYLEQNQLVKVSFSLATAPVITKPPADQAVNIGAPATFTVTAVGAGPLSYQWRRDGVDIPGATASSYTLAATTAADNGAIFSVLVTGSLGSTTSGGAKLTVNSNGTGGNGTIQELKLAGTSHFGAKANDRASLTVILTGVPGISDLAATPLSVNIGGATATFTLDKRGRARNDSGNASMKFKVKRGTSGFPGGNLTLNIKLKGALAAQWIDEGIVANTKSSVTFAVAVQLGALSFSGTATCQYTGRKTSGSFKTPRK